MDLYGYFARKDELIDLMVDEAVGGAVLEEIPYDWRDALAAIAHALRAVCLAHPWVVHCGRAAGPDRVRTSSATSSSRSKRPPDSASNGRRG